MIRMWERDEPKVLGKHLLNEIDVQEFVAKAEEYSSNPLSEQYAIEYTELDLQYQTILNPNV